MFWAIIEENQQIIVNEEILLSLLRLLNDVHNLLLDCEDLVLAEVLGKFGTFQRFKFKRKLYVSDFVSKFIGFEISKA